MRISSVLLLAVLSFSATPATAAQDWSDIEVEAERVTDGVYVLRARGGNIGVSIGEDGIFLIDDQFAPLTPAIRARLDTLPGGKGTPVRFVLNTHFHGDHTGGNENLGKAGAVIVAHDNVRKRMSADEFRASFLERGGENLEQALPVVTFNDRVTFHINGRTLATRHYPHAHTDGDSVIRFTGDNIVHMGDTYFASRYPFIDIDHGGSLDGAIAAVDDVLAEIDDDTVVIPGHGELSNKAELRGYRDMLAGLRDAVKAQVAAGKTLEEIKAMNLTRKYDARFGEPGDRFMEMLFRSAQQD